MPEQTSRDFTPMPSKLWTPQQKQIVTGNYVRAYANAPEHHRAMGETFYPSWNEDAQHIGEAIGQGTNAGAALLAHLSPANEAELNRIQGIQLVHGVDDKQARFLTKAGASSSMHVGAISRRTHARKTGDTGAADRYNAEAEMHKADASRFRAKAGITGTPLSGVSSREIANALRIKSGNYKGNPLDTLGDVKIGDFGRMIADPSHPNPPIDTHYHDAGVNRTDIPYIAERGLSAKGRYQHFQMASEDARQAIMRQTGTEIEPSAFMGSIWYGHQQRKVNENPDARKARVASETKLNNIRGSVLGRQWLPENYGLRPSFGKIDTSV